MHRIPELLSPFPNQHLQERPKMSSKWRALQHRHRYSYSSVVFPKPFTETLNNLPPEAFSSSPSSDFFTRLKDMASLTSTYSQISAAKDLSSAFSRLLAAPEAPPAIVITAARLYLEVLFLDNSLPLHRTLISALAKARRSTPEIAECFASVCEEYGEKGRKRFAVSRAVLSMIGYPKMGFLNEAVEKCATLAAMDVATGLAGVVLDIEDGSRPSPVVMEQCQEAMSCLYYVLQRYPSRFVGSDGSWSAFESVMRTIFTVLKSASFSRDCLVAAGVSFCAAIRACMRPEEVSSFMSVGLFGFRSNGACVEKLGVERVLPNWDLYTELSDFSVLSRLCLLRGILTAIPRSVLNSYLVDSKNGSSWTILYNGILPELCEYCENPVDSHFNFHALTVTQICMQQIKTSILADLTDVSGDYDPLCTDMIDRILRIIWNNLGDPLSQTVKQVHLIFNLLLDIISSLPSGGENGRTKEFMCKISADLLHLGPRCKGRYIPLASLTKRLGAKHLLNLNPNLMYETTRAYIADDVCCAITSFLKCFLECLRDECWSHDGIERGYDTFRGLCLPPLLQGLVSGHSKLRSNLNTYALPVILDVDMDSIFPMLAFISVGPCKEETEFSQDIEVSQCVAALVSLLKVSRTLALIEGDIELEDELSTEQRTSGLVAIICIKGIRVRVLVDWFVLAMTHADESLRIDAAESLVLNPKTASLPSSLELSLMRKALPLNMRCTSTGFQMKWTSLFRKFFSRVRTALERQVKQGSWQPIACFGGYENGDGDFAKDIMVRRAHDLYQFMKWLSCFLFYSCYPSAPYERKIMAMELILIMIDVWPTSLPQGSCSFHPYNEGFTSPDSTVSFVGCIVDSWDRLRESSFRILSCFPTPLPGISSHDSVNETMSWAKKLVCSPRVRESDAGALTLRLIFKKYVLDLGWVVEVSSNVGRSSSQSELTNGDLNNLNGGSPAIKYISSLIEWLQVVIEGGEKDLSEACRNSFVHGVLLTLRYTFEELDWNSEVVQSHSADMKCLLEKLLELIMRVTSLALWVVSADAWYMPDDMDDMDDMVDGVDFLPDAELGINTFENLPESTETILNSEDTSKPAQQVVMVGCWLAMKEVSLLLGTIIRKIPLSSCIDTEIPKLVCSASRNGEAETMIMIEGMFDLQQLEIIGNHFLQVLFKMKHNGAIDKTRAGFTALCNRLLCSNDRRLCNLTEIWMEQLMERTIVKGQTVDDLLRRSAGIPAAFIAFFLSEPEGTPKKLLPRALRWLIDIANTSLCNMHKAGNSKSEMMNVNLFDDLNEAAPETLMTGRYKNGGTSKIRDEGVIPTVHAFNVLRAAFNDTNLTADTSGFSAEALIVSIRSFSSPYWEVRNSACLAYTVLVRRMIGFLNVQKRESTRRALTGLEIFHRYPALHSFLFSELKIATELLGDGCSRHMELNIAKAIHPSLCPILILLSRLKPSIVSSGTDDALDPFLFMPFIRKCATQSNLRVRVLASKALTGLVSNEKLHIVLNDVANTLPPERYHMPISKGLHLGSSVSVNNSNSHEPTSTHYVSFNHVHGVLLLLLSLLDSNCRNLCDSTKKDQIIGDLTQVLLKCSWIGSSKSCPCPTLNSSYLHVLDHMLSIARTYTGRHVSAIQDLLLEMASECLDNGKYCGLPFHDPTKVELQKQAASSYFICVFGENPEAPEESFQVQEFNPVVSNSKMPDIKISVFTLHEKISSCISDSKYEVRLATLKRIAQAVKSIKFVDDCSVVYLWAKTNLLSTLMQLLAVEENSKCIYYILKIIFSWNNLSFEKFTKPHYGKIIYDETERDSVFCFWDRLVHLNNTVTQTKTREVVLCCMGLCVKEFARMFKTFLSLNLDTQGIISNNISKMDQREGLTKSYKCINSFTVLIKQCSAPSETVNMRKAAAEAMTASGLLEDASFVASVVSNSHIPSEELHDFKVDENFHIDESELANVYASRILDLWFTCIQLLEDEDVELRQKLAMDVQKHIDRRGSKSSHCIDNVPAQVEEVIESCFEFLSSVFCYWLEYFNYLATWVSNTASSMCSKGDLVRQIFDKEIDNHHEEKLLICQLCCSHLEKLLGSKFWTCAVNPDGISKSSVMVFSQRWRVRFLHQLVLFTEYLELEGRADWIGGIGNHKDGFTPLYASLLGLYVLTQHPGEECDLSLRVNGDSKLYLTDFIKFIGISRPFLKNPLISNLYILVIQSHEKYFGISLAPLSGGNFSIWAGFDPYFLLR